LGFRRLHILQHRVPGVALPRGGRDARAHADLGAAFGRIEGVQRDEPGVLHPAIEYTKAGVEAGLEHLSGRDGGAA
jgi:hypothetical protein